MRAPIVAGLAVGAACLALLGPRNGGISAAVLAPVAVLALARLQARQRVAPPERELDWLPLILDLTAAGLVAGQPLELALAGVVPAQLPWLGSRLGQVAAMLRLGADPVQAWQPLAAESRLQPLVATAVRSSSSGIRLAASLTELAAELRAERRASVQGRAQRAGVWVIAPLGLCFLPAFVCLGIVPVVLGLATSLLHSPSP